MMASASRPLCIDPSETKSVVESAAGWLAFKAKVTAMVMTTARTAAQRRGLLTISAAVNFGAPHAWRTHNDRNPAASATKCPTMML